MPETMLSEPLAGAVQVLRAAGTKLTQTARAALAAAARKGEGPAALELEAIVFIDRQAPNRNHVRFTPTALATLARTLAGQPFLRDHAQRDLTARGGTIKASELVAHEDGHAIRQTIEITEPSMVAAALEGRVDRFSIGWHADWRDAQCSACAKPMVECEHWPGDRLADGKVVEVVYTAATGVETSAVSVPAVVGTGVEAIRATLSAARDEKRKRGAGGELALELAAERSAHETTRKLLTEATLELGKLREAIAKRDADGVLEYAFHTGRLLPGEKDTAIGALIADMTRRDLAAARTYVKSMPQKAPVGLCRECSAAIRPISEGSVRKRPLDPLQAEVNQRLGLSEADFNKFYKGDE